MKGQWRPTEYDKKNPALFDALKFYAQHMLGLDRVGAARVGRGIQRYDRIAGGFFESVIVSWEHGTNNDVEVLNTCGAIDPMGGIPAIDVAKLRPHDYQSMCAIQFLMTPDDVEIRRNDDADGGVRSGEATDRQPRTDPVRQSTAARAGGQLDTIYEEGEEDE